ncbi:hypothetical protein GCM10007978_11250 [Shewanella hanedai]|uniref:DUF2989 domain-containing protein n=2 Tax=Shewanella hanedai TaxID=25 RepID=A0A553JRE2_SHEHA|nr:DUF2989 domain-containing protein [Shewanella hanedai]GGI75336.1 hypothetical protein GCM10007978_11250 [Shewanella hanedai]
MTRSVVMFKTFFTIWVFSGLLGCDGAVNNSTICKNNPEVCADLHKDSWCRYEKSDLIKNRLRLKHEQTPSGKELYLHLTYLEKYNKCVELASGVKHILHPERSNDRARAFGLSAQSLAELQASTKDSNDIHLAFYHWTRFNNSAALEKVLRAQKLNLIDDIDILARVASYFQKFNPSKAKTIYLEVLNRSEASNVNPDWLLGLANTYQKTNEFELTYLLSRANILMSDHDVSEKSMSALVNGDNAVQSRLDEQAEALVDALESGNYPSSNIKLILEKN